MDAKRRRKALEVIKGLNATKHSKNIQDLRDELESKVNLDDDMKQIDEADREMREDAREGHGFDKDYDVVKDLNEEDEIEEEKVPEVNDMGAEFMELLKQLKNRDEK